MIKILRLWEWRFLLAMLYLLPLREAPKNIVWGCLITFFISRMLLEKCAPSLNRIGTMTVFWISTGVLASVFAIEPAASWKGLWDMVRAGSLLWIAASHLNNETSNRIFLRHLIIATALASAIALFNWNWALFIEHKPLRANRVQLASVGHSNQSGVYLAMGWMLCMAVSIDREVLVRRWVAPVCCMVIGIALLGSMARVAIVVCALGTLGLVVLAKTPKWITWLVIGGAVLSVLGIAGNADLRNRAFFRGSLSTRVTIWDSAWKASQNVPITGVGLNNFKNIQLSYNNDGLHQTVDHAHSIYFNTLAQAGIPGFVALIGIFATGGGLIWNMRPWGQKRNPLVFYAGAGVWLIIAVVGYSNSTLHHEMSMLFFLVMGMVMGNSSSAKPKTHR
jgi:O-antigen ligase